MMTDDDRAKMVEELRGRILFEWGQSYALDESSPTYDGTIDTTRRVRATLAADACLPIIEKLLAAHDLDALLDDPDVVEQLGREYARKRNGEVDYDSRPSYTSHCDGSAVAEVESALLTIRAAVAQGKGGDA